MNRIIHINLSTGSIHESEYNPADSMLYGKSLAGYLVRKNVQHDTDRYCDQNCLVFAPGLLSGTTTPCTGRITVASKEDREKGTQFANIGGPFSQKLASLNIAAIVVTGCNETASPLVINISKEKISIEHVSEIKGNKISEIIGNLRLRYGSESSIIGIGSAGDHMLPLAAIFSTYPVGEPAYTCARGGMGDIFGSKGLKALVVNSDSHFGSSVVHVDALNKVSKELSGSIIEHKICGGALPAYGSITLMKLMAGNGVIKCEKPENKPTGTIDQIKINNPASNEKINRTCAPLCVIGCLNRHSKGSSGYFRSPADSEVLAALKECFEIDDAEFASDLNFKAYEMGLDSVEFVFSCALFFKIKEQSVTKQLLLDSLEEILKMTLTGRVIGSKTNGIYNLFKDRKDLQGMVTKPSINEGSKFDLKLPHKLKEYEALNDKEYLYAWMTLLSSFGICLFSSFALIESEKALDGLADLFYCKTGLRVEKRQLIENALKCLTEEEEYEYAAKNIKPQKKVPEFVKVLHRYFSSENQINL